MVILMNIYTEKKTDTEKQPLEEHFITQKTIAPEASPVTTKPETEALINYISYNKKKHK